MGCLVKVARNCSSFASSLRIRFVRRSLRRLVLLLLFVVVAVIVPPVDPIDHVSVFSFTHNQLGHSNFLSTPLIAGRTVYYLKRLIGLYSSDFPVVLLFHHRFAMQFERFKIGTNFFPVFNRALFLFGFCQSAYFSIAHMLRDILPHL